MQELNVDIFMGESVFFLQILNIFYIKCWLYYVTCEGRKANWNC
jgi:hypothetical protein